MTGMVYLFVIVGTLSGREWDAGEEVAWYQERGRERAKSEGKQDGKCATKYFARTNIRGVAVEVLHKGRSYYVVFPS